MGPVFGVALGLLAGACGVVEVTVEATPALPPANLLVNGDFERGKDGWPDGWRWGTAMPENFRVAWTKQGRGGSRCVFIHALSGEMSGYWNQVVKLQAGRKYLLRGWYRLAAGRMLVYVHARTRRANLDERFYAGTTLAPSLIPNFLKPEYVVGGQPDKWLEFRLPFRMPEGLEAVEVSLGMYFMPGRLWFDDVSLTVAEADLKVCAVADEPIERLRVYKQGEGRPVWDSGPLTAGGKRVEFTVRGVAADGQYRVEVVLAGGRVVTKLYPERMR